MAFNYLDDPSEVDGLLDLLESYEEKGAPDPNLFRALGKRPKIAETFADHWDATFYEGIVDHGLKEIVRLRISYLNGCSYCGSIGSNPAKEQGLAEKKVAELDRYETEGSFTEREKTALRFADEFHENDHDYESLTDHFTDEEIIELVWLIGLCDGLGKVVSKTDLSACRIPVKELQQGGD